MAEPGTFKGILVPRRCQYSGTYEETHAYRAAHPTPPIVLTDADIMAQYAAQLDHLEEASRRFTLPEPRLVRAQSPVLEVPPPDMSIPDLAFWGLVPRAPAVPEPPAEPVVPAVPEPTAEPAPPSSSPAPAGDEFDQPDSFDEPAPATWTPAPAGQLSFPVLPAAAAAAVDAVVPETNVAYAAQPLSSAGAASASPPDLPAAAAAAPKRKRKATGTASTENQASSPKKPRARKRQNTATSSSPGNQQTATKPTPPSRAPRNRKKSDSTTSTISPTRAPRSRKKSGDASATGNVPPASDGTVRIIWRCRENTGYIILHTATKGDVLGPLGTVKPAIRETVNAVLKRAQELNIEIASEFDIQT